MRPSTTPALTAALILTVAVLLPSATQAQPIGRPASVRLEVAPRDTQVYIDGYLVGMVDDFDGLFQRLHMEPGEHEIVLYLNGYRTIKQTLKVRPGGDYKVRQKMVKLAAGEKTEPPPAPAPRPEGAEARGVEPPREYPPPPPPYAPRQPGRRVPVPDRSRVQAAGFGTLAIRVQPEGAEVLIDGSRWRGPETSEPLVVQLAEGTHHVEVRKEGYVTFSGDVRIREGEASPLNISLPERR